jgi:DNA-binding MarR family transcriptional regulator
MKVFDPYQHLGFLTNRIGRLLANQMGHTLAESNIHFPTSCIGILADLWAGDGINQKDLGVSLIKTKSSINKMLAALEDAKMIRKENDPNDKRGKLIYLTQHGKEMQTRIEKASLECDEMMSGEISKEEIEITKKVLSKYYERLLKQAATLEK